jgi:hypothetical protein
MSGGQKLTISASLLNLEITTAHHARRAFLTNELILVKLRRFDFPALGFPEDLPADIYIKLEFGPHRHWITLLKSYCAYPRCKDMIDGISSPYCSSECKQAHGGIALRITPTPADFKTALIERLRALPIEKRRAELRRLGFIRD